jgi:hypothetical protein
MAERATAGRTETGKHGRNEKKSGPSHHGNDSDWRTRTKSKSMIFVALTRFAPVRLHLIFLPPFFCLLLFVYRRLPDPP